MTTSTFTTVRTAHTLAEADVLIASLQQAGLHPLELTTAGHFSLAGADIEYRVQVPSEEAESAAEILKSWDASATT